MPDIIVKRADAEERQVSPPITVASAPLLASDKDLDREKFDAKTQTTPEPAVMGTALSRPDLIDPLLEEAIVQNT